MERKAQVTPTPDGAMVHDPARLGATADAAWLDEAHWRARGPVAPPSGGRGAALRVGTPAGPAVLRHYRRGGLVARFNRDRYLWQGEAATRPFREFALLQSMIAAGLPAPVPLAARYRRAGLWYRGDLLTLAIEGARTLAEALREAPSSIDWTLVGRTIGRFHALGFPHPDLNAHNILLGDGACHLVDFDRGAPAAPAPAWMDANLARLRRSLDKLGAPASVPRLDGVAWPALRAAHAAQVAR
jgi:3-deoxy-D-manno-octulosonic acid kinase